MITKCPICFDIILCSSYYECNHLYCIECFIKWNYLNYKCPLCRCKLKYNLYIFYLKIILSICYLFLIVYIECK